MLKIIQEVIEVPAVKIKREHDSIDHVPEQGTSHKIEELKVSLVTYRYQYMTNMVPRYRQSAQDWIGRSKWRSSWYAYLLSSLDLPGDANGVG